MRYAWLLFIVFLVFSYPSAQVSVLGTPDGVAGEFLTSITLSNFEVLPGTDRLLTVVASADQVPLSVTFGGTPMIDQGMPNQKNVWTLVLGTDMVSSTIGDVVFTIDGSTPANFLGLNAIAFSQVDQSNPIDDYQQLEVPSFSSGSQLQVDSRSGDLVFDGVVVGCLTSVCGSPPVAIPDAGQSIQNNLSFMGMGFSGRGATSTKPGIGATCLAPVDVGWSFTPASNNPAGLHVGMNIRQSGVNSTNNVGINIASPQRELHVNSVLRLEPRACEPESPGKGDMYFDSTVNKLRVYDGSVWQDCW